MDLLIRSAIVIDPTSPHNGNKLDILVKSGRIAQISKNINAGDVPEYKAANLHISPGFVDMQANFRDPGHEYKEDLLSGCLAAIKGGFTKVCIQSSTEPTMDNKVPIESVVNRSKYLPIDILPIGALTSKREGQELAELYDMQQAGAVAFSDDKRFIENPKLFELALQYVRNFDGLVIHFADTPPISKGAVMNEGNTSVYLGLKGAPAMAEEMALQRDLYILEYTQSRLHYSLLSTPGSANLIADAKKKGLKVTAGIGSNYLIFDDEVLNGFDSVHKVRPPYRTAKGILHLKEALKSGAIDIICSDHSPEDVENKRCELEHAAYGIINLETCFPAARTALEDILSIEQLVEKLAINPRKILGIEIPTLQENGPAEFTLFDPDMKWKFEKKDVQSRSDNSPFFGFEFIGKILGLYTKENFHSPV